jgi:hypothetical protein
MRLLFNNRPAVENSPDLQRILDLPRRTVTDVDLSDVLRLRKGRQDLRPAQSLALYELAEYGGLLGPMHVGGGKTLVALLAPYLLEAERPVMLVPAAMKRRADYMEYAKHWPIKMPLMLGYEELGRASRAGALTGLRPDLVIADEAHRLKNPNAAVTRRVTRYVEQSGCRFLGLSGTFLSTCIGVHRMGQWALGDLSPFPHATPTAQRWDAALDPTIPWNQRALPGALFAFGAEPAKDYHQFTLDSPGVVHSPGKGCAASLVASKWRPEIPEECRRLIAQVEATSCRPDGEPMEPVEEARCLAQLALGCWYSWDPLPPLPWLDARRRWVLFVQSVRDRFDTDDMDSPAQIEAAYPEQAAAWHRVKSTYKPRTVVRWVSDAVLRQAVGWAKSTGGVVWTRWDAVGKKLQSWGLPYYGQGALGPDGTHVEQARGPIAASIRTCGQGANLQYQYQHSLFLDLPGGPDIWEQLIGRTHRSGQPRDEVFIDINASTSYHQRTLRRALQQAADSPENRKLALAAWAD